MAVSHVHARGTRVDDRVDERVRAACSGLGVVASLVGAFMVLTDPRKARGKRHELASVLVVTVLAVLAGARNYRECGDRAGEMPREMLAAAGVRATGSTRRHRAPSAGTIRRVVQAIDADAADRAVGAWITARVRAARARADEAGQGLDGLAMDGKTVRNSGSADGVDIRLFSALLHREQVVIAQVAVPRDTNEITCVQALLAEVDLTDTVVTADAAHTQDATATYLTRARRADYVLTVKGNRPTLMGAIATVMPPARSETADHTQEEITSGTRVVREIWVVPADQLGDQITFPGAAQVFRIRRRTYDLTGTPLTKEIVHGITSLTSAQAGPAQLAFLVRHHWRVESNHWLRDVVYREDHQQAHTGNGPHVMAALRNLTLAILRLAGYRQITRTLQQLSADRSKLLDVLANIEPLIA